MKLSAIMTRSGPKFYMGGEEVVTLAEGVRRAQEAGFIFQVRLVKPKRPEGIWRHASRLKKLFSNPPL